MRNGHAHIIFMTFKQVCQADQNPQSLAEAKGLHVFILRGWLWDGDSSPATSSLEMIDLIDYFYINSLSLSMRCTWSTVGKCKLDPECSNDTIQGSSDQFNPVFGYKLD